MTHTKTIAGLIGPLLAVIGVFLLARPGAFATMAGQLGDQAPLLFVSGALILVAGLAIVRAHNVWVMGWPVIVTLVGWLSILAGITRLLFPQELADFAVGVVGNTPFVMGGGVVALLLGGFLTFMSFRASA